MDLIRYRKMLFDEGVGKCAVCFGENKNICISTARFVEFLPNLKKVRFSFSPRKNIIFT